MNRIRVGAAITALAGVMYGSAGLLISLRDFGIGVSVAAAAVIVYGCCDFIESHQREQVARYRAEVWHRRDREAAQRERIRNLYEVPRDGLRER